MSKSFFISPAVQWNISISFMHNMHIWKKKSKWLTQKTEFFNFANSQYLFVKISWIGPWVSSIDWYKEHWCNSTYMAVRLSDISSKTGKKCVFCVFRLFLPLCQTASRPYRLSYINALRIARNLLKTSENIKISTIFKNLSRKLYRLVLGLVELIDAKGIDVAQPIWSWGCPT